MLEPRASSSALSCTCAAPLSLLSLRAALGAAADDKGLAEHQRLKQLLARVDAGSITDPAVAADFEAAMQARKPA